MESSFPYQNIQVVIYLLVLRKRLFHLWALHQRSSRISKNKLLLPSWVGVFCCFELPLAPDSLCCSLDCRGLPSTRGELCIYFPSWGVAKPGWICIGATEGSPWSNTEVASRRFQNICISCVISYNSPDLARDQSTVRREISQIIKPLAGGFIIFIGACGSASFELFRVPDESHTHKGRRDIWGNSS